MPDYCLDSLAVSGVNLIKPLSARLFLFGLITAFAVGTAGAGPLDHFRDCELCPEMIELPLGRFDMGTPDGAKNSAEHPYEADIRGNEGPSRKVTIDLRVAMSRNEITIGEFMSCVTDGECPRPRESAALGIWNSKTSHINALTNPKFKHFPFEKVILEKGDVYYLEMPRSAPILRVTYLEAKKYTNWLNKKLGTSAYRLPTEAEWEYAARAGTTTPFAQGNEPTADQVNINGEATERERGVLLPQLRTLGYPMPVDEMDAENSWGFRHMSGNASEITMSCYSVDPESLSPWKNSSDWMEIDIKKSCPRVLRGGSYAMPMQSARVASREAILEDMWLIDTGFRIVKDIN